MASEDGTKSDASKPTHQTLKDWIAIFGRLEYNEYTKLVKPPMSYDEWVQSELALGAFLWHVTLDVWDSDSTSSDEDISDISDVDLSHIMSPQKEMPVRSKNNPSTNGNGVKAKTKSSTSTPVAKPDEQVESAKRKRKPKKPYLSEEIIASDDSDGIAEPPPAIQVTAPAPTAQTAAAVATKGRRKSGGRRKKQFLSEEIISPLDEADDPTSIDAVVAVPTSTSAAPSLNKTSTAKSKTEKPKRGKEPVPVDEFEPPRKSQYRNDTLSDSSLDAREAPDVSRARKTLAKTTSLLDKKKPTGRKNVTLDWLLNHSEAANHSAVATPKRNASRSAISPDGPGSSSRRGLRARTAAQQNPYQHDRELESLIFDERVSDPEPGPVRNPTAEPPPKEAATATKQAQKAFQPEPAQTGAGDRDNSITFDDDDILSDEPHPRRSSKAHYKGKGRAWKKTESDEDDDFKTNKPKKSGPTAMKSVGGRRKSASTIPEPKDDGIDHAAETEPGSVQEPTPQAKPRKMPKTKITFPSTPWNGEANNNKKKARGPNKKSKKQKISEEFVKSDTDTDVEPGPWWGEIADRLEPPRQAVAERFGGLSGLASSRSDDTAPVAADGAQAQAQIQTQTQTQTQPVKRGRGRPKKSAKTPATITAAVEAEVATTPAPGPKAVADADADADAGADAEASKKTSTPAVEAEASKPSVAGEGRLDDAMDIISPLSVD